MMAPAELRDWLQIIISGSTFIAVLVAGMRVVSIAQKGVDSHERRITDLEEKQSSTEDFAVKVVSLISKVEVMTQEMERMRNRLDRFLDTQSNTRKSIQG